MSKSEKRLERLLSVPNDYEYSELVALLNDFGYCESNAGKTSGSEVKFYCSDNRGIISIHRPHPGNIVKHYVIKLVIAKLEEEGKI